VKLGLAVIGLGFWGYGTLADVRAYQYVGIAFLAGAALLRFWRGRGMKEGE
jgi:hypothetical protein